MRINTTRGIMAYLPWRELPNAKPAAERPPEEVACAGPGTTGKNNIGPPIFTRELAARSDGTTNRK
jgi:hypothetical protein